MYLASQRRDLCWHPFHVLPGLHDERHLSGGKVLVVQHAGVHGNSEFVRQRLVRHGVPGPWVLVGDLRCALQRHGDTLQSAFRRRLPKATWLYCQFLKTLPSVLRPAG
jgi:hypothetical protein